MWPSREGKRGILPLLLVPYWWNKKPSPFAVRLIQAWFTGVSTRISEYALLGVAQIVPGRSRKMRGRQRPALDALTSRFAPPPPRALIPVIRWFMFLHWILCVQSGAFSGTEPRGCLFTITFQLSFSFQSVRSSTFSMFDLQHNRHPEA
jgi:hypothetical protein